MDAVVFGVLEEICSEGVNGLTLRSLWPKIQSHLSSNGLHLCSNVKKALWSNLLNVPSLRFECRGVLFDAEDPKIQSFEESEAMNLKIVAAEHLLNSFVGIYDIKASDAGISQPQRRLLERLAIARTDGVTQNELAKELGIKNNNLYYIVRNLESRGLIVRQSTIIRKKEAGYEGEHKNSSIVNTNMLHLYRYAKHLGRLQRLEIIKEDKVSTDNLIGDRDIVTGDGGSEECIKEDVHIKDYLPALRAVCDRLDKADGKVLVVSDIKKELGYRKTPGHRAWRNILHRLKDAHLVEEFLATVNNKEVSCIRLLKKFSLETFVPKSHGRGDDDLDTEQQAKLVKRGQITEQVLELPLEQQIYDMIDAEGSKGLTLNEVYKRLGINNKRYYPRILDMVSRFRMHLDSESLNRGVVYRAWTYGNYNSQGSSTFPGKSEETIVEKFSTHGHGQLMLAHTIQESDHHLGSKVDAEAIEEQDIDPSASPPVSANDTPLDSTSSQSLRCEAVNINSDAELQIVKPASNFAPIETSSSASPAPRVRRSYTTYPRLGLNSANSLREQRILEKLQEEKVLIKPELHRVLESLDNLDKKFTTMDKRTLERSLNKLQEDGLCKCISFAIPAVTNCGRTRIVDVVLHPSVYKAKSLSDIVQEKMRSFERQVRVQSISRHKSGEIIPVLNDVERIGTSTRNDAQNETFEAMRNNGFVLAKMVRAKLFHIFLWGYLTGLNGWDDAISGKHGYEQKNPHNTCKLFELDAAIKAMPLELFLQVAGSSVKLESMIEKCRNGLCLSDLSIQEYRLLMDTQATTRLSRLVDILRRLKLIRLIGGELLDAPVGPHATLRYSLELKPYIEEPVRVMLPSTGVNSHDLRPHVRHDFVLASRKGVDEYWNTLEYCYATSNPKAALHAFPGSAVNEVFLSRSWQSVRVMTAHQRAELFKLVENDGPDKKLSYKKCEKIAENLNLTLEQVLRVYYDKRQKNKLKGAASVKEQHSQSPTHASLSHKRKRSLKGKPLNDEMALMETSIDEEPGKLKHAKMFGEEDATEEQNPIEEVLEDQRPNEDEQDHSYSAIHECALSKLKPSRQKRFEWTGDKDRLLVIEYARNRAALGAKFHRTDWASLQSLPGPPSACRRRISLLNANSQFRKAVMRLCNMLSVRYMKHLQNSKNKLLGDKSKTIVQDLVGSDDAYQNAPDLIDHTKDFNIEEPWDDFDNKDIKIALDDVLQHKKIDKSEVTEGAQPISQCPLSHIDAGGQECDGTTLVLSATPSNESKKNGGQRQSSTRRSRRRLPKSYARLMNGGKGFDKQSFKSLAVSNAIELFKLVFLSSAKGPEVPNLLAETLRRYSEHDLFTAFNYLRERNFMVRGSDVSQFVLSQQFLHSLSSSPFPVNTGKRAIKMTKWLHERENDLLDKGVDLFADLQCGDVLQLCVLMCSGELSMFPCLPDDGVGEIEDLKKRKCDDNEACSVEKAKKPKSMDSETFFRREKGFPGIHLSLSSSMISRADAIALSDDESAHALVSVRSDVGTSSSSLERYPSPSRNGAVILTTDADSESTWEAMTFYAKRLADSAQEPSPFYPDLFKTVYSAIQKTGDQGLSMEGICQIIDGQGEKRVELIVEVLESFGRALKVNAYDSVHVVDPLYQPKYLLASMVSHQHAPNLTVPEFCTNDTVPLELQQESHDKNRKTLMERTCTDLAEVHTNSDRVLQPMSEIQKETCTNDIEVHTSTDEVHRVTILNHPEDVLQSMNEIQRNNMIETYKPISLSLEPDVEKSEIHICTSSYKPILPWVNGDGTTNEIVYKGLVRRVLGIVMQNPGILEEHVIRQMNVLNPQSCKRLLELMILDNHITVRKMCQSISSEPPAMLHRLLGSSFKKPKMVFREHLFANPASIGCL